MQTPVAVCGGSSWSDVDEWTDRPSFLFRRGVWLLAVTYMVALCLLLVVCPSDEPKSWRCILGVWLNMTFRRLPLWQTMCVNFPHWSLTFFVDHFCGVWIDAVPHGLAVPCIPHTQQKENVLTERGLLSVAVPSMDAAGGCDDDSQSVSRRVLRSN